MIHQASWRSQRFLGRRMSCNGGASWMISGTITFERGDSFESRTRFVPIEECSALEARYGSRTVTIVALEASALHKVPA